MNGFIKYWNHPDHVAYLFLTPSFLVLLLFTVISLLGTFAISFTDLSILFTSRNFVSSEDFTRTFSDKRVVNSLIHSLYFTVLETPAQIIVGLLVVIALSKNIRSNHFCRSTFYIPVICSSTSTAITFFMLLDPSVGMIPYLSSQVGLPIPQLFCDSTLAIPTVAIMTVWENFGATVTIFLTVIQGIFPSLYESAQMDGATNRQQSLNITLPQIVPPLGFCILTNLVGSMQVFDQVHVAATGGPRFKAETAIQYIYSRGFTAPYELSYTSALFSVLSVIVATIAISTNVYILRKGK